MATSACAVPSRKVARQVSTVPSSMASTNPGPSLSGPHLLRPDPDCQGPAFQAHRARLLAHGRHPRRHDHLSSRTGRPLHLLAPRRRDRLEEGRIAATRSSATEARTWLEKYSLRSNGGVSGSGLVSPPSTGRAVTKTTAKGRPAGLCHRACCNGAATLGKYSDGMEAGSATTGSPAHRREWQDD
jgi:hypothetical protein